MHKKGIFILLLILVLGIFGYNYLYQDHRDISAEKPDFEMSSQDIVSKFELELSKSEKVYNDKTIQVNGVITELNASDLTLDDAVFCQFSEPLGENLKIGENLNIKGRCIGFDDLLEQVKLNECSIIK